MLKYTLLFICFSISTLLLGQGQPINWMNMDSTAGYYGTSTDKAYNELLKERKARTVIVAVIDSGVDIEHEDLKGKIWTNIDEIPGNGIDDDKNGYIDDINGWNFIGGKDGKNVHHETLEVTRLYAALRNKYRGSDTTSFDDKEKQEYALYLTYKEEVESQREKAQRNIDQIEPIVDRVETALNAVANFLPTEYATIKMLDTLETNSQMVLIGKAVLMQIMNDAAADSINTNEVITSVMAQLKYELEADQNKINYEYNPDFDSRAEIVKDDYCNGEEKGYGNNDVEGPDALHGTHVAGIIAANRKNDLGMDGIANAVKIMSIRTVPDGDERDKDVANAIYYAVDNGASIINMSFGKGHSWNKNLVDNAVKYAEKNDVLIVHAAGNSGMDSDSEPNFPNDKYDHDGFFLWKNKVAEPWISVGALNFTMDENMIATFSNYGQKNVDLFAPGVEIYSTTPDNKYQFLQGTSMAAPVVAGMAAVLRSYFPGLSARQVKEILMDSTDKIDKMVSKPGSFTQVPFSELSQSGGVVNLYNAVKIALKTKGKNKVKKEVNRV